MNLILSLKKKIANRSNPEKFTDKDILKIQERRRLHDSGHCPKAELGYTCRGGIRNGEAYGECI